MSCPYLSSLTELQRVEAKLKALRSERRSIKRRLRSMIKKSEKKNNYVYEGSCSSSSSSESDLSSCSGCSDCDVIVNSPHETFSFVLKGKDDRAGEFVNMKRGCKCDPCKCDPCLCSASDGKCVRFDPGLCGAKMKGNPPSE